MKSVWTERSAVKAPPRDPSHHPPLGLPHLPGSTPTSGIGDLHPGRRQTGHDRGPGRRTNRRGGIPIREIPGIVPGNIAQAWGIRRGGLPPLSVETHPIHVALARANPDLADQDMVRHQGPLAALCDEPSGLETGLGRTEVRTVGNNFMVSMGRVGNGDGLERGASPLRLPDAGVSGVTCVTCSFPAVVAASFQTDWLPIQLSASIVAPHRDPQIFHSNRPTSLALGRARTTVLLHFRGHGALRPEDFDSSSLALRRFTTSGCSS